MAKRRGKTRKRGRRSGGGGRAGSIRLNFRAYVALTLAGGLSNVNLAPTSTGLGIARLTTASDVFEKYRFTRVKFRLICDTGSTTGDSVICFMGKTLATSGVATLLQAYETNCYSFVSTKQTVHGQWCSIPKTILRGMLPWYQTQGGNGASDTEEDNQGVFYLVGSGTATLHFEIVGTIELATPADPTNTPMAVEAYRAANALLQNRLSLYISNREKLENERKESVLRILQSINPALICATVVPQMSSGAGNPVRGSLPPAM